MTHLDISTLEARIAAIEARLDALEARARKLARLQGPPARIDNERIRAINRAITDAEMRGDWDERERLERRFAAIVVGGKDEEK